MMPRWLMVRTTLHLDDDVYEAVRSLAAIERTSIGKVLSRLARRALNPARARTVRGAFPVFDVPADARLVALAIRHRGRLATFDRGVQALVPDGHTREVVVVVPFDA
jgi:hypothetical protein